jgi:hypothetical protein
MVSLAFIKKLKMNMSSNICRLHRIYKITFANGKKYVGQTVRLPKERFKEHKRESSGCTHLKNEFKKSDDYKLETIAVTGSYDVDDMEKVLIALNDTVYPNGLNITIGGKGVVKPNDKYNDYKQDVMNVYDRIQDKKFVSYDIMFMKNQTKLKEAEFKALQRLFSLENC